MNLPILVSRQRLALQKLSYPQVTDYLNPQRSGVCQRSLPSKWSNTHHSCKHWLLGHHCRNSEPVFLCWSAGHDPYRWNLLSSLDHYASDASSQSLRFSQWHLKRTKLVSCQLYEDAIRVVDHDGLSAQTHVSRSSEGWMFYHDHDLLCWTRADLSLAMVLGCS